VSTLPAVNAMETSAEEERSNQDGDASQDGGGHTDNHG
jgi:hypothetical protein